MNTRAVVFVMVATMLFTFSAARPANAIVPALAWAVWGIATGVATVAVVADETRDHEQAKTNNQGHEERKELGNTASDVRQSPS
jgi:hypothetical protein